MRLTPAVVDIELEERVSSRRTQTLWVGLTLLFLSLLIWRTATAGFGILATVWLCLFALWLLVPPVLLLALIHMADPDIDGWRAVASYPVLWSVLFFGVLAAACAGFCAVVLVECGQAVFAIAAGLLSAMSGGILVAFGSGATTTLGLIWSFTGSTALVFLTVVSAVVPAVALGWPRVLTRSEIEKHA